MRNQRTTVPMSLVDVIKNGYFQQVRFLVDHGFSLDTRDVERRTALMLCAFIEPEAWGVGIARLLIENGARLDFRDKYGLNAFHYAVIYDRVDLVRVYLNAIDFDLNESDKNGNTALHFAVRAGNTVTVKLIAQAHAKYKFTFEIENNDGFTPLKEAYRLNSHKCARILETTDVVTDTDNNEASLPLDLTTTDCERANTSFISSSKSMTRPHSSIVSRRSSKSSCVSSIQYSIGRSASIFSSVAESSANRRRIRADPTRVIPPHEKNDKKLIHCVSKNDIRNNPEYLFHVSPIEARTYSAGGRKMERAHSAFVRRSELERHMHLRGANWRGEFRRLYAHYQYQCTPSYRDTAINEVIHDPDNTLPSLDNSKPVTPASSEHDLDQKGRKGRVKSGGTMSRQNTEENLAHGTHSAASKRGHSSKQVRKMSQSGAGAGKAPSVDGSLESSSESINSMNSKRHVQPDGKISSKSPGKDVNNAAGGRASRNTNSKGGGVPSVNVELDSGINGASDQAMADANKNLLRVINE